MSKKSGFNKLAQVGARVRPWVKEIIRVNNYSISDAVTYFAFCLKQDNPVEAIKIQIFCKEKDLKKIREKLRELKHQEQDICDDLDMLESELKKHGGSKDNQFAVETVVDEKEEDSSMGIAVSIVQRVVNEKKAMLFSSSQSKQEFMDVFISLNGDFVYNVYNVYGKGMGWNDFKESLIERIEV